MIGETFGGKYIVVRLLGQGGMGAVYEARHQSTGRRVALKVMTDEVKKHPAQLARFERETRAAGALESQYIAQVFDGGVDARSGSPFLVMELLTGSDLDQLERKVGPLSQHLAVRVIAQATMGLSKAHAAGIVHRDIKPGNMFLAERDDDVVLKLLDFGVAKVAIGEEDATSLTTTGSLIGTPLYMSPEQAAGEKSIDARTDVWSLGVVLYQALAGKTPHHDATTIGKLILRICQQPAAPIASIAPWVSPALAEIVHRALAIDPAGRFQSAEEMLAALRALAPDGLGIRLAMLTGVSPEERARRSSSEPPPEVAAQPGDAARERTQLAAPGVLEQIARAESSAKDLVRTTSASSSDAKEPPPKSSLPLVALAALATFGLTGAAYFGFMRGQSHDGDPSHETTTLPGAATRLDTASTPVQITPGSAAEALAPPSASPLASASSSAAATAATALGPTAVPQPVHGIPVKPVGSAKKPKVNNDPTSSM